MEFVKKNETNEEFYSVNYNKEELEEILKQLEAYSYVTICNCRRSGFITRWPTTKKNIEKRVISSFNEKRHNGTARLLPETIEYNKEYDCVTYDYTYEKLPDLYDYIDLLINNKKIIDYTHLFGNITRERTGSLNMFYAAAHKYQLILEGILNYINSPELTKHLSIENERAYDYYGLNELYRKTLECFNFSLIAIKEYLEEPELVDTLELQLEKKKQKE